MRKLSVLFLSLALAGLFAKDLGKPLTLKEAMPVAKLMAAPDSYVGKTVQVTGKVTEVCTMAGCWMNLIDVETNKAIRVKVNDGEIVFPKEAIGKTVIAEGTLRKLVLSKEQAVARMKHEAEETGRKFDPAKAVAMTIYQLQGLGARIPD